MQQDGYVNDKDIIDSNAKLIKQLENMRKLTEWDIKNYTDKDKELADYDTQQLNKVKTLIDYNNYQTHFSTEHGCSHYPK